METSTIIVIAVLSAVVVAVCGCCCFCCCCRKNSTPTGKPTAKRRRRGSPENLESGWFEPTQRSKGIESDFTTKGIYRLIESDGPEERPVACLPYQFHDFVVQKIIPYFNDQRLSAYQFAVVVLLSENDFDNIFQTSFIPSDFWGRPILNKNVPSMPQDLTKYGNYVVARPSSNSCHSEEEIFGQYSVIDTPFYDLWRAYVECNGTSPKCILIYSWNLPCSRCTEAIIRSLREEPYNRVSVILAHTIFWTRSESDSQHKINREKLMGQNITVEQVKYPEQLLPA